MSSQDRNIVVRGIGWLTAAGFGGVSRGTCREFAPDEGIGSLAKMGIFPRPFRNYGRLDAISRATTAAVALALSDACIDCSPERKQEIGIIGTGSNGSLLSDTDYFRDYVENGRTLSRANLFIYTLPSSPLGEAAIYFGLQGPLLYTTGGAAPLLAAVETAADMIEGGEASLMLAGRAEENGALYFLLDKARKEMSPCTLEQLRPMIATTGDLPGLVERLTALHVSGKA